MFYKYYYLNIEYNYENSLKLGIIPKNLKMFKQYLKADYL